jgi:ATP-dependent Lon protease
VSETSAAQEPQSAPEAQDSLIILSLRNTVLFPQTVLPITIRSERTIAGAQEAVKSRRKVGLVLQRDATQDEPDPEGLHHVGTMASIVRYVTAADGTHHLICQGEQRFKVLEFTSRDPFLVARIEPHPEPRDRSARDAPARACDRGPAAVAAGAGGAGQRHPEH